MIRSASVQNKSGPSLPCFAASALTLAFKRSLLRGDQPLNTLLSEIEQRVHLRSREWRALRRALHFNETTAARHDHIHISVAGGIFGVIEVEYRRPLVHTHRNRRHEIADRRSGEQFILEQIIDRIVYRDKGARDAGS